MGKTSLALDIAVHVARSNHLTGYFSFEMTKAELVRRILSKRSRVNVLRMRHGNLEDWQFDQVKGCCSNDRDLPLIIDDGNFTPSQIEAKLRDWNRQVRPGRVEVLIVDHLQIAGATDKKRYERRDLQLAAYTGQLKDLAKRYSLVILLLSQLNRGIENRPPDQRAPRLADLRESGAIEQDSDCVIGLWRKFPDTQQPEDKAHAEICLLKNRSGPIGRLDLTWIPELAMFTDPSKKVDEEGWRLESI
jgi:replicative DNA helicase